MKEYSIKDIEAITGIKAHTIRIWEKRYNIVEPSRTDSNIRFYTNDDVKKLLSVSTLNNYGIKISKIASMTASEISNQLISLSQSKKSEDAVIDALKVSMIEYNEQLFNSIFNDQVFKRGIEKTVTEIIYPFLEKVGFLWLSGTISPAQEHFISNLIRQKLYKLIDGIDAKSNTTVLTFLFENEWHELGVLFYSTILKLQGFKIIYLGQSVPYEDISNAIEHIKPEYVLTSFIATEGLEDAVNHLDKLANKFKNVSFIISGETSKTINLNLLPKNIVRVTSTNFLKF